MDKKCANILLISDKDFDYKTLVEAGYKNVFWFKSTMRACEYFEGKDDELDKFDIFLSGSRSLGTLANHKFQSLFHKMINHEDISYMCFFSTQFEEDDEKKRFYVSYPDLTRDALSKDTFLSILNDSIPEELKGEKIEIPDVEYKEIILPKKRGDVKVLFMGYLVNQDLVKKVFNEAGFTNYDFIRSNNFTLRDNVESFADYDLVVVDSGFNGSLSLLGDEFQDYMKDKGKSIYFVVYSSRYKSSDVNELYAEGFTTEDPRDKRIARFKSLENEDDALKDLVGVIINSYCYFNHNMGDGGYPNVEELDAKFQTKRDEWVEKNKVSSHTMSMVSSIKTMVEKYRRFYNRGQLLGYMENALKGLKVDVLEDGVSVAFIVGNREAVRITFKDDENTWDTVNNHLNFYLEYLNEKGTKMCLPVKRICSTSYSLDQEEDYPSDEELKKIEALYKRVESELGAMIENLEHVDRSVKNCSSGNKNKRYNKRYV